MSRRMLKVDDGLTLFFRGTPEEKAAAMRGELGAGRGRITILTNVVHRERSAWVGYWRDVCYWRGSRSLADLACYGQVSQLIDVLKLEIELYEYYSGDSEGAVKGRWATNLRLTTWAQAIGERFGIGPEDDHLPHNSRGWRLRWDLAEAVGAEDADDRAGQPPDLKLVRAAFTRFSRGT